MVEGTALESETYLLIRLYLRGDVLLSFIIADETASLIWSFVLVADTNAAWDEPYNDPYIAYWVLPEMKDVVTGESTEKSAC